MNLTEARRFAAEHGFTHVYGVPVAQWEPYGVKSDDHLGQEIEFHDDPPRFELGGSWPLERRDG